MTQETGVTRFMNRINISLGTDHSQIQRMMGYDEEKYSALLAKEVSELTQNQLNNIREVAAIVRLMQTLYQDVPTCFSRSLEVFEGQSFSDVFQYGSTAQKSAVANFGREPDTEYCKGFWALPNKPVPA